MAHTDADRLLRKDLQCDGGPVQHLTAHEHRGALELGVVSSAAAEELILPRGRQGEFVHQQVGVASQRVGHHES